MRVQFKERLARIRAARAMVAAVLLLWPLAPGHAQKAPVGTVTIFAAASLKNALDEATSAFARSGAAKTAVSLAASSALAKQIEKGAPADLFISADTEWMDYLAERKLIDQATRSNLLGNRLVLIAPAASDLKLTIGTDVPLAAALGADGRLAVGEVTSVPAGRYAKAALENLKVWTSVEGRLAQAENVRAALKLVALGEAPLGIVYRTDALSEPAVKVIGEFPAASHPPIIYPVAVTAASANPEAAKAYLSWLAGDDAAAIFKKHGFEVLK